jgi:hypothetical protein
MFRNVINQGFLNRYCSLSAGQVYIRAVVYLASRAGNNVKLEIKEIARELDAPEAFTAKILQIRTTPAKEKIETLTCLTLSV